jgi:N-acyl-D-aspartate/D-glutamate deacylase
MEFDLLLRGGLVVDGSGLPGYIGDVGIKHGKIADIGRLNGGATRTVDVSGLVVSPGFIDHHTHLDAQLFWDPYGTSEPEHGITSVIFGNCGLTLAPVNDGDEDQLVESFVRVEAIPRKSLAAGVPWGWNSVGEYLDRFEGRIGVNVGGTVGHIAVRHSVMGKEALERTATSSEIESMQALVRQGMLDGALGFSTNRNNRHVREDGRPVSSRAASEDEVLALCDVLGDLNAGVIAMSSGPKISFFGEIARRTNRPVTWQAISHQWSFPNSWREKLDAIEPIFRAGYRAYGLSNTVPLYRRFNLKTTQVFDELPAWKNLMFLPEEPRKQAFADPATRAKLGAEFSDSLPTSFHKRWDLITLYKSNLPEHAPYLGKTVLEMAGMREQSPLDAFLDMSLAENLETTFLSSNSGGDPDAVGQIMRSPHVLLGVSDAGAHVEFDANCGYATTLLSRWVRERQVLTLEQAIHKLTFQVASAYELRDRGLLRPGYAADVAVFNPETVRSCDAEWAEDYPAGARRMVQHAEGMHYTIVNGAVICEDGRYSGELPGSVLRGAGYTSTKSPVGVSK